MREPDGTRHHSSPVNVQIDNDPIADDEINFTLHDTNGVALGNQCEIDPGGRDLELQLRGIIDDADHAHFDSYGVQWEGGDVHRPIRFPEPSTNWRTYLRGAWLMALAHEERSLPALPMS